MEIFNRRYNLSIIEQVVETITEVGEFPLSVAEGFDFPFSPPNEAPLATTTTTRGGDSLLFNELHIEASIKGKATSGNSTSSTIRIFNPNTENISKITKWQNAYVILEAGYGNEVGIVFKGNIISYDVEKINSHVILTLVCSDSDVPIKTARVSVSYAKNFGTYADIFRDVTDKMRSSGITIGKVELGESNLVTLPNPSNTPVVGGFSFSGYLTQLLDKLCEQFDYVWYITLNEVYIHPKYYGRWTPRFELRQDIVKSLRPKQDKTNISPTVNRPTGLKLVTFLDYRFKIGDTVNIPFGEYRGVYKVLEVEKDLSYEAGNWDSILDLEISE